MLGAAQRAGDQLVQACGTMAEIVTAVGRVTELIAGVIAAASQQNGGIQSVNASVSEFDQGTQQNAAPVEQSAAAMSLRNQAEQQPDGSEKFKLVAV